MWVLFCVQLFFFGMNMFQKPVLYYSFCLLLCSILRASSPRSIWCFYGISMGISIRIPCHFYGVSMGFQWDSCRISIRGIYGVSIGFLWDFLWDFFGNPMGFPWYFYWMSITFLVSAGILCSMGFLWDFYWICMRLLWDSYGICVIFLWDLFGIPAGFPRYFSWIPMTFT